MIVFKPQKRNKILYMVTQNTIHKIQNTTKEYVSHGKRSSDNPFPQDTGKQI